MAEDEKTTSAEGEDAAAVESAVAIVPANEVAIRDLIYTVRGTQVMIDSDLAALYQVETKAPQPRGQAQRRPVPRGFQVQDRPRRARKPKVPNWHLTRSGRRIEGR